MTVEPIRVVLADDYPSIRAGVRMFLDEAGGFEVVAEVETSDQVIRAAVEHQPDVVVMDLRMPGVGGVEATRTVVRQSSHIAVLVLTMVEDSDSIFAVIRAGARGYLRIEGRRVGGIGRGRARGLPRRVHHQPGRRGPDR